LSKDGLDCRASLIRVKMPIPPTHGVSLMSHELVDDPLIDTSRRQVRRE
jgi:hypothetical protein